MSRSLLCASLLLVGCGRFRSSSPAQAEVERALASYSDLMLAMAPDRLAASYTPDGELSDAEQGPVIGPDSIRAFLASFSDYRVLANRLSADSTRVTADTAWQVGTYSERVRLPAGDTVEVAGRFQATWLRSGAGEWRLRRMHTMRPAKGG